MRKISDPRKLLITILQVILCLNIFFLNQESRASDVTISSSNILPQTFNSNGAKLTIASGGNLSVSNAIVDLGAAASDNNNTSLKVEVNANSGQGITSSGGGRGAFELTSSATLATIVLNSGLMTSDYSGGGTISLMGAGGTGSITTSANTTISNTATSGYGINSVTTTNTNLTITNAGTISTNNNASSVAIRGVDSNSGSSLILDNSGTVTAGASGTAITLTGYTGNITNSGTITGSITGVASSLNITNSSGTISGNITLGSNSASTLNFSGGTVTGNITMNNSAQITTYDGGSLTGTIDGVGQIIIDAASVILNGNIGATTLVNSITVNDSDALDIETNSNSIRVSTISLGTNSSLTVGSNTISGAIQGTSDGSGTVNFNADRTLDQNIGTSSNSLATIALAAGKTLTTGSNNLDATTTTLGSGSSLTLSSGTVTGAVQGLSDGVGAVSFTQDFSAAGNFGTSSNSLSSLAISANKTLSVGSYNIDATTTTLGSGSTLTLSSGTLTGAVQGLSDGVGTISFTQDFTAAGNFGTSSNSLSSIAISASKTLTTGSNNLDATTITLASGSALTLGSGSVTGAVQGTSDEVGTVSFTQDFTAAGNFGTSSNSLSAIAISASKTLTTGSNNLDATTISLGSGSALTLSSGTVTGAVQGSSDGVGTVSFTQDFTAAGNFGTSSNSLSSIAISASRTLSVGSYNIDATTTTLGSGSTLTLSSGTVTGAVQGLSDGVGTISFTQDFTAAGNFGSSSNSLSAIAISASKTLTTGSNNLDTTTTTLASGSALTLSSGTVTGTVQGLSDGVGTVSFTQDFTAAGNFGTSSNSLSSIAISASRTLTTGSNNLDATTITLGSGSTLTLSSGTVTGAVQGTSDGVGTISFTQDFTAAGNFGSSSNSLSAIAISASKTLTTGSNNLDATTITLGSGSTLTLSSGTVTGAVQGTSDGVGTISFTQDFTAAGNFGSSSNSLSAIAISASKTLTTGSNNLDATTITLGSGSTLTLSSGTVTGAVQGTSDGVGTISFTQDFTAAGNFGSSSNSLSAIAISANKTLSVGSYNLDATTTTLASGSVLTLGSGTVTGAVQGISDGVGTISFTQDFTAAGNFGTSSNSLSAISVASGKTVNFGDNNLDATTVSLNSSAALSFGSGTISGTIQGVSDGIGTINFNADRTLSQDFGTSGNSFAAITIAAGKTLSSGSYNLDATLITLNSGSTLTLANGSVNGVIQGSGTVSLTDDFTANNNFGTSGNSLSAIVIAAGKTFNLGNNNINSAAITLNSASALSVGTGEIIAPINGSASGVGILNISGINNINSSNPIGQSNALAAVNIADNTTVTVSNSVSATNLTIGDGAELIYSGGTITGQIRGLATNQGTLEIASDMTSSAIGTDAALSALNINSGKTLTVGGNISANNILVTGTFDLGNSSRVITGNIAGSGAGFINAGNASHTISGDLNLNSGDSLALAISSVTSAGKLIVDGAITNSSGTNLEVTIPTTTYIPSGTSYVILEGSSGSSINAISNIDINNSGNSKVGNLLFSTSVSDDDLLLTISRSTPSLTQKNMQTIYDNIAALGSSSSGELRNFQTYLDFLNDSEMSSALASATAQIDNSVNRNSVNSATLSVLTTEGRMKMDYASASPEIAVERMKMAYAANGLSQNQQLNNGVWVQGFTAYAHQDNEEFLDGYKLNELGTAIGYDHKTSKNSRLGAALSYGNSSIKSVTSLKKVTVDSYQANIYGSYNFDKIFFNAIGGFAWNNYNSKRAIPAISETAQADYQGQTYVGKIKSGYVYNFGKGFRMIPEAMVTYVHNHTEGYEESGAGTMNLKIASQNSDFLEGRVGLNFDYWYSTSRDTKINPELRFSYGYDFLHDNQAVTSSFVGQSSVFVTQAPDVDPKSFKAGFGINLFKANSMTFTADYNLELKSNYVGHYGFLRARYNF